MHSYFSMIHTCILFISYYDASSPSSDTKQLANMEYGVCIRRADSYCGVTWKAYAAEGKYTFTITENAGVVDNSLIGEFLSL